MASPEPRTPPSPLPLCQLPLWYERARGRRATFQTSFVPLPPEFVGGFLRHGTGDSGGHGALLLPAAPPGKVLSPLDPRAVTGSTDRDASDAEDDLAFSAGAGDDDESQQDSPHEQQSSPAFPDLEAAIERSLAQLGGTAFAKLNWSSPRDAAWVKGSLACCTPGDVYLLLGASDFVAHDLAWAAELGLVPTLALRRWSGNLKPSNEFRCFVRDKCLVAICQRHCEQFFAFLPDARARVVPLVRSFFSDVVLEVCPELADFAFDVYVEGGRDKVWLVDVGPLAWSGAAAGVGEDAHVGDPHPLLSWDALRALDGATVQYLVVRSRSETSDAERKALSMHKVPLEVATGDVDADNFAETLRGLGGT